jgi:hypothetical protein
VFEDLINSSVEPLVEGFQLSLVPFVLIDDNFLCDCIV